MESKPTPAAPWQAIAAIRDVVTDLLSRGEGFSLAASRILTEVRTIEVWASELQARSEISPAAKEAPPQRRSRQQPKQYSIKQSKDGEWLAEFRIGNELPFYCPRVVVESVAKAVSQADRPLSFPEILAKISKDLPRQPSEFQVRVALRYLGSDDVGLIKRERARYCRAVAGALHKLAGEKIKSLSSKP